MERSLWNFSQRASLSLLLSLFTILPRLEASPVWQTVPQKKDILPNPKGTIALEEQSDRYLIYLQLPGRDLSKVLMNLRDGILHIEAPADGSLPSVRRDIVIEGSCRDGSLSIDRTVSRGLLVVIVPKEGEIDPYAVDFAHVNPARYPMKADFQDGFAAMISQMQRVHQEMEAMTCGFSGIVIPSMPSLLWMLPQRELQQSCHAGIPLLVDAGDRYVVRISLPGQDLSKVNVNLRDRLLTIEAKNEIRGGSGGCSMNGDIQYSQAMNLPGPVLVGKMKVDRRGDELVVTLPKLGS